MIGHDKRPTNNLTSSPLLDRIRGQGYNRWSNRHCYSLLLSLYNHFLHVIQLPCHIPTHRKGCCCDSTNLHWLRHHSHLLLLLLSCYWLLLLQLRGEISQWVDKRG